MYCERNNPVESNLSNNFHNTFDTCDQSELFTREHLWIDGEKNINEQLIDFFNPSHYGGRYVDYIIFSYLGCDYTVNPTLEIIQQIYKNFPQTKLIFLWWDASHPCNQQQIHDLNPYASLHVNYDASDLSHITDKAFFCGVPQSSEFFFPDEKQFGVSFCGRTDGYGERCHYLNHLIQNNFPINIFGGRTQQNLTPAEYGQAVRQSRININFSNTPHGFRQVKGRIWEILCSKTLLLEQDNGMLSRFLRPGIDYVTFSSPQELLEKAQYYLDNSVECDKITEQGYQTYLERFQSKVLWQKIYDL